MNKIRPKWSLFGFWTQACQSEPSKKGWGEVRHPSASKNRHTV